MRKTVLLVEDSPDEIVLAQRAFAKAQLDVDLQVATSGIEACRLLLQYREKPALPDLILLDMQMQGLDGVAVLRELRLHPQTCNLPVVFLTSSDEPGDIAAAYAGGANSYLRKPVSFDQFVKLIQDVHQYWLVYNRTPPDRPHAPLACEGSGA